MGQNCKLHPTYARGTTSTRLTFYSLKAGTGADVHDFLWTVIDGREVVIAIKKTFDQLVLHFFPELFRLVVGQGVYSLEEGLISSIE